MLRQVSTVLVLFVVISFAEGFSHRRSRQRDSDAVFTSDDVECPAIDPCTNSCEHGYKKDHHGCTTCDCKPACPPICRMHCEHGFKQDKDGCDICECRVPYNRTHRGDRTKMGHRGEHVTHHSDSSHRRHGGHHHKPGHHVDVKCKPKRCPNRCAKGYSRDSFGCRTCGCAQTGRRDSTTPAAPAADPCLNKPMCTMFCEFGFQKGSDGCDVCKCNAAP